MISLKSAFVLLTVVSVAFAEPVDFKHCPADVDSCTISEARIDPCPNAANHIACNIRRRKPHTMSYDFTPNFDADTLEATLSWAKSDTQDLPLLSLDKDACKYTTCPVKSGVKQTYTIDVPIESKFPTNSYTIKWRLTAPSGKQCCFMHEIKVVR